jgi:arginine/lysine/ornithine decarboxylase
MTKKTPREEFEEAVFKKEGAFGKVKNYCVKFHYVGKKHPLGFLKFTKEQMEAVVNEYNQLIKELVDEVKELKADYDALDAQILVERKHYEKALAQARQASFSAGFAEGEAKGKSAGREEAIKRFKHYKAKVSKLWDKMPELAEQDLEKYDKCLCQIDRLLGAMEEIREFNNLTDEELK